MLDVGILVLSFLGCNFGGVLYVRNLAARECTCVICASPRPPSRIAAEQSSKSGEIREIARPFFFPARLPTSASSSPRNEWSTA